MRLSVVITNFDYEQFLARAIDSALALDWPDVEVVVVENGSSDGSADLLRGYGDRVVALFIPHGEQRLAANAGFAASTGDVVVFLDADDTLPASLPHELFAVMTPRTSKVQFRMQRIDVEDRPFGAPFPAYRTVPSPEQVRRWMTTTSAYPTPPGSGNAYARWFLERIMPMGPEAGTFLDSACLAAAPLLGDVVTAPGVLVGYRRHGENDSAVLGEPTRFSREVVRARDRWRFALGVAELPATDAPLFRSRELLQFRAAAHRLTPGAPGLPGDGRLRTALGALASPAWPGPERVAARLVVAAWTLAVVLAPRGAVGRLLRLRYGRVPRGRGTAKIESTGGDRSKPLGPRFTRSPHLLPGQT